MGDPEVKGSATQEAAWAIRKQFSTKASFWIYEVTSFVVRNQEGKRLTGHATVLSRDFTRRNEKVKINNTSRLVPATDSGQGTIFISLINCNSTTCNLQKPVNIQTFNLIELAE